MNIGPSFRPPRFLSPKLASSAPETPISKPGFFEKAGDFAQNVFQSLRTWENPNAKAPSDTGGLKLATYNIWVGGKKLSEVDADLRRLDADVVCLQETTEASARRLAERLGMHMSFYAQEQGVTRVVGKAILSRHPIEDTRNIPFKKSWGDTFKAIGRALWNGPSLLTVGEPLEKRSFLSASLKVGGKEIEILDAHLSFADPVANAKQQQELADYVAERQQEGKTVILAGDFNTNFALAKGGTADANGTVATPTDTAAEYRERYGVDLGNVGDAKNRAATERLLSLMKSNWQAPERLALVDGQAMTPEEARQELASGKAAPGSERHKALLRAMDGITNFEDEKRYDNILATSDVRIASTLVDQTTRGSDHQPVLASIRWDG
ncbi:endonuclease/exonuclease/phosphatase family protein [bacterium]|nr:endonuclease/exonuclease/phosphatase family protein [bacterium]